MACDVIHADVFAAAVSHLAPAGVILTAAWRGQRHAVALTSGQILAADPGSVMVSVDRRHQIYSAIMRSRALALHILGGPGAVPAEHQREQAPVDEERLLAVREWATSETGLPVLNGAAATLECHVETTTTGIRSHVILACRVDAIRIVEAHAAVPRASAPSVQA